MNKESILEKIYLKDFTELVPATIFNGDSYMLTVTEFEKLCNHMRVSPSECNIIKIANSVFVNDKQYNRDNNLNTLLSNQKLNIISNEIKNININGDLNELGNLIGQIVGKYFSDDLGFEEDDFISGIEHGISVSNDTHK